MLLSILLILPLTACTQGNTEILTPPPSNTAYPQVHILLLQPAGNQQDAAMVYEQLNVLTREKIGVEVVVDFVDSMGSMSSSDAKILTDSDMDLFVVSNLEEYVEKGYVLPLDDLLDKCGTGIRKVISDEYMEFGKVGDRQYGLFRMGEKANSYGVCMRRDLLEETGYSVEDVQTFEDLERVLAAVKGNHPEMYGIAPMVFPEFDNLSNGLGVLMQESEPMQVVNFYETESFRTQVERFQDWKRKGYLYDLGYIHSHNSKRFLANFVNEGMLFSYMLKTKPGIEVQESNTTGHELVVAELRRPVMSSNSLLGYYWGIYSKSKQPDAAMKLLNLLFTDSEINNLICWGIEGTHYVKNRDGTISYPEGTDVNSVGYNFSRNWQLPNQYLAYSWKGDPVGLGEAVEHYNRSAVRSPALGFLFDETPVQAECKAVQEIVDVYMEGFLKAELDVTHMLPQFINAMKGAGIDTILKEKQRQLDEWHAGETSK